MSRATWPMQGVTSSGVLAAGGWDGARMACAEIAQQVAFAQQPGRQAVSLAVLCRMQEVAGKRTDPNVSAAKSARERKSFGCTRLLVARATQAVERPSLRWKGAGKFTRSPGVIGSQSSFRFRDGCAAVRE